MTIEQAHSPPAEQPDQMEEETNIIKLIKQQNSSFVDTQEEQERFNPNVSFKNLHNQNKGAAAT